MSVLIRFRAVRRRHSHSPLKEEPSVSFLLHEFPVGHHDLRHALEGMSAHFGILVIDERHRNILAS